MAAATTLPVLLPSPLRVPTAAECTGVFVGGDTEHGDDLLQNLLDEVRVLAEMFARALDGGAEWELMTMIERKASAALQLYESCPGSLTWLSERHDERERRIGAAIAAIEAGDVERAHCILLTGWPEPSEIRREGVEDERDKVSRLSDASSWRDERHAEKKKQKKNGTPPKKKRA